MRNDDEWTIACSYECVSYCSTPRCKHAVDGGKRRDPAGKYDVWQIPRVVQAWTQGGADFTVVCLDCILEAAE